ncbi:Rne/Rng family ribonuclease [Arthrospira platensis]|jgi:ribonuclease E|uniref:Ribonuclease E n=1 Tax=Limnospira platensis NIES-46 TaxID=1236695 RepID=A0A5M3T5D5_LIMPL|nr:Rne/Rng family ribonuclease [Arthrospira platensis]KDR58566.1 ribonuclease E [Arthrospira platensis str. Paraca]MBD2668843.1 Rne/Rng family ribonuclease [Arthrospira platensis FACHB-439]MBD2709623.1 Rne/Rng family ribonuclease [Arthrospira platensis FACHB-835]MDT9309993.1 Rne/Rng family ribonuclease [Limnospira sp. Paracas R14]QQW27198.1 Rne/Rng family ribonuclease [Arthrospira sp. PCC 9108]
MSKQIIIAEQHRIAAVFSEDEIQELVVATGNQQVSDIYLGIVENVLPGIDAAFVNIGDPERNGFIHVSDLGPLRLKRSSGSITELLMPQQKVLVQVMKEPTGTKGPRLTGNITLPGRYLVLMPYGRGVNLSRRIRSEAERNRLRALAILIKPSGMGLLVRTEAEGMAEDAILEDLEALQKQWEEVQQEATSTRPPALLNRDNDFIQRVLRDMYSTEVNRIVVDSADGIKRVKQHLVNWSVGKTPQGVLIDHHRERIPILEYFRVNAAIREALRPRVDLPSGGYIIIEPTEALTVIDVNSGSFTRSATSRETVLWTNCEAATEIARQLRLRNIAGVIIVDFIDMDSRRDQLQVLEHFNKVLKADKSRPQIAQLSELGLVELTRKRQGQNIYELFGRSCPTCNGLGHLIHLPGESAADTAEASERFMVGPKGLSSTPGLDTGTRTAAVDNTRRVQANVSSVSSAEPVYRDDSEIVSAETDTGGNFPELELLNHPSYQDIGGTSNIRRRRRRRIGDLEPLVREEEGNRGNLRVNSGNTYNETTKTETNTDVAFSGRQELTERFPKSVKSDAIKAIPEPPEVVAVEMTGDEQDVYALMGISPLVLSNQSVKNARNAIVTVRLPGDTPLPLSSILEEETDTAISWAPTLPIPNAVTVPPAENLISQDDQNLVYNHVEDTTDDSEESPEITESIEVIDPSDLTVTDINDVTDPNDDIEDSDYIYPSEDSENLETEGDAENTPVIRRRRRRSSAVSE